ncbi:MAG TPA: hypothetical protein PLP19_18880 [bacterium]|nr:hypothetical protein [bacterium]HPN45562.1 hypothetical protein [bacterium]
MNLKKFNTILVSIGLVLLIIILSIGLYTIIKDNFPKDEKDQMLSETQINKLLEEDKRIQLIDFNTIDLLDSLHQIYIIPVYQKSLQSPEEIETSKYLTMEFADIPATYQRNYIPSLNTNNFYYANDNMNNLIIYYMKKNISYPLFEKRISIIDFVPYKVEKNHYLFIIVCDKDTNEDGVLNNDDLLSLFSFNILTKEMKRINKEAEFIESSNYLELTNKIILKVGIDRNKNNKFDKQFEPLIFKQFDIITNEYSLLIDEETINKLQKILDGK